MRHYIGISTSALLIALFASAAPAQALTIIDNIDPILAASDPGVVSTINAASNAIASLYSNPVTVTINFSNMSTGLGQSNQYIYDVSYANYTTALRADAAANPQNTTLATAVAHLGQGNGASGLTDLYITSSQYDMLHQYGLPGSISTPGGNIGLKSSIIYWGSGPVPASEYSGTGVVQHEIDEILGGGGAGSMLGRPYQSTHFGSLDLYRYSAAGVPSYTSSTTATAYFSINGGATNLVNFNQNGIGDYGDFTNTCYIQNWAACAAHTPENFAGSIEDTMLQSIGYDHFAAAAPAPLPGTGLASLAALALAGLYVRTRRA